LVVGFASSETRSLSAVEIDILPEEISLLAVDCRTHIIDLGRTLYPNNLQALADNAKAVIISHGTAFHEDIANYIAGQIRDLVLANRGTSSADLAALSEDARTHIVDLGVRLAGRGLRDQDGLTKSLSLGESTVSVDSNQDPSAPSHLIHFRVASSRPTPQMVSNSTQIFLSESGDDAIVAWVDSGKVLYLQSQGTGWSSQKQINLTGSLDAPHAFEILKQRARSR